MPATTKGVALRRIDTRSLSRLRWLAGYQRCRVCGAARIVSVICFVCALPLLGVNVATSMTLSALPFFSSFRPAAVTRIVTVLIPAAPKVLEPLANTTGLALWLVCLLAWAVVLVHWIASTPGPGAVKLRL